MQCDRCRHAVPPLDARCRICGQANRFWRNVVGWTVISMAAVEALLIVLRQ